MVSKGEEGRDKLGIQDEQIYTGGGLVAKLCPTLVTPWTVAPEALLSMRFFRQEYWSGLPFPSPGDLLDPGIELSTVIQIYIDIYALILFHYNLSQDEPRRTPALQADSLLTEL